MIQRVRQILLAPVLGAQAVQVIRRTPRLPEAAGPRSGEVGTGEPLSLLVVGDSSAAGVGVSDQESALSGQLTRGLADHYSVRWQLVARTGMTTARMVDYLDRSAPEEAVIAVTALGVNDATRLVAPRRWVAQTRALHHVLRSRFGVQRIYVTAMPPLDAFPALPQPLANLLGAQARAMWEALRSDCADDPSVRLFVPDWGLDSAQMARDGFHPGAAIYARWGQSLAQQILRDGPVVR
ncbi:SGNH/GDSL hydrolase family protein [uncultured Roseobacter sp.]|uniref:SGNH/GDSL hydrolase family protein n=1 Tax=uncultured Roseobacter sp. TaxID=114847 RepID=UPI0026376851|nr:SGNH/GDSL hydrolase family protein [uncultured Roseobacter sp.]